MPRAMNLKSFSISSATCRIINRNSGKVLDINGPG